ncbi:hypothetical protein NsoK4_07715 [Nitrosopumilus sp. K4]|uniref:hypothetical protein n=1 Tax=Nitrosopumilus sp. K4 TaxID=2795383 RepID=UPI001BABA961|nr:hypothetical protein [Nitrosopumilus sp. K4]QUC64308.1 hypothetical protein NsoK4_07715 [Nitrosopumilus sp. K4]
MEINNISLFFVGILMSILGTFVVVYDYPQIQYFDNMESESYLMLEGQDREIHQRLKIEFTVGSGIFASGIIILIISIFKKQKTNVKN